MKTDNKAQGQYICKNIKNRNNEISLYNLEFYLYIFSADYDDLIRGLESMKKDFPTRLSELENEKQEKIIFKLNNLNTKILK